MLSPDFIADAILDLLEGTDRRWQVDCEATGPTRGRPTPPPRSSVVSSAALREAAERVRRGHTAILRAEATSLDCRRTLPVGFLVIVAGPYRVTIRPAKE